MKVFGAKYWFSREAAPLALPFLVAIGIGFLAIEANAIRSAGLILVPIGAVALGTAWWAIASNKYTEQERAHALNEVLLDIAHLIKKDVSRGNLGAFKAEVDDTIGQCYSKLRKLFSKDDIDAVFNGAREVTESGTFLDAEHRALHSALHHYETRLRLLIVKCQNEKFGHID